MSIKIVLIFGPAQIRYCAGGIERKNKNAHFEGRFGMVALDFETSLSDVAGLVGGMARVKRPGGGLDSRAEHDGHNDGREERAGEGNHCRNGELLKKKK